MIANSIIQNTIEELGTITKTDYWVYDDNLMLIARTSDRGGSDDDTYISLKELNGFFSSPADSQVAGEKHYFKVRDDGECIYVIIAVSNLENPDTMGRVAVCQLQSLLKAYRERLDKTGFFQNLILDNMLLVDIHNRAQKLHIENDLRRIVYLIEVKNDIDSIASEVLKSLYLSQAGNNILSVDEQTIILIKDLQANADKAEIHSIADEILNVLNTEAMLKARVAYGLEVCELKDISKSYKEARMALDVGNIFYSSKKILSYENLGIGRLIYQLPLSLCELFVKEVFGEVQPSEIDEETLITVDKFFENNLNVSETSRQLFIHRNTLVYRMEKLQRLIGLDMRTFEDALTFRIAMMVVDYIRYLKEYK